MELIKPTDPQYFKLSSEEPYDRHHYKVVDKSGDSIIVESWEEANVIWWHKKMFLSHIEVLDQKEVKGFK